MEEHRLYFRSENDSIIARCVVQWLHADSVARQYQSLPSLIPQREREHAREIINEAETMLLIRVDNSFAVGCCREAMAAMGQIIAQRAEIVDLAVVH